MTTISDLDWARRAFADGRLTKDELVAIADGRRETLRRAEDCPLQPLDDRIVARELPATQRTAGGIHLVDQHGPVRAQVVAVGPGRRCDSGAVIPPPAAVGDVVLLTEHGPTEIEVGGEMFLCAPPMLVLAVERDERADLRSAG